MPPVPTLAFDYVAALPEIVLLIAACTVLMVDLFVPEPRRHVSYWLTLVGIGTTAWLSLFAGHGRALQLVVFGGQFEFFHAVPIHTFGNMFVADAFGDLHNFLTSLAVMVKLV
jgi:NADH:ubiquinone oxidoreductase subunit 2 (subunit N)